MSDVWLLGIIKSCNKSLHPINSLQYKAYVDLSGPYRWIWDANQITLLSGNLLFPINKHPKATCFTGHCVKWIASFENDCQIIPSDKLQKSFVVFIQIFWSYYNCVIGRELIMWHSIKDSPGPNKNIPIHYIYSTIITTPTCSGWGLSSNPYHICSLISLPSISIVLILKSIPISTKE